MSGQNDQRAVRGPAPGASPPAPDLADALADAVRVGYGIAAVVVEVALRSLREPPSTKPGQPRSGLPAADVVDLVIGTAWGATKLSGAVAREGTRLAAPVLSPLLRFVVKPPLVPRSLQPGIAAERVIERWRHDRPETVRSVRAWSAEFVPNVVATLLAQVDTERLISALLDSVDLDDVRAQVMERMDVGEFASDLVSRLDVGALAADVLATLDLNHLVSAATDKLDLDAVTAKTLSRVDLDPLVAAVLEQIDITDLVLDNVDLERVVAGVLQRLDLTAIVVDQVDLGAVVAAALQRLDLTEVVLQNVDLIAVAEYVVEGIDLPEIIRDSTGSVATEAVRGMRMQGVDADLAVARVVDRVLRRRRPRHTDTRHMDGADDVTPERRV